MKKVIAIILSFIFLFLCSCNKSINTSATTEPLTTEISSQEPIYIYENAEEDFLEPVEQFSWERKYKPEFVMVHFISAVTPHPEDPYNMDYIRGIFIDYDISVHYIIERDGTIHCYIPEDRVAWHAGAGEFKNDPQYTNQMNQYAIGIEVVSIGSEDDMSIYMNSEDYRSIDPALIGYTEEQYTSLKALVTDICERNEIPMDREHVIGHEDYSPDKTDPGTLFDWDKLIDGNNQGTVL